MGRAASLSAVAAGILALVSGCLTGDTGKKTELKKPDVTKPGVLPPPQELMRPSSLAPVTAGLVPAGGISPAGTDPAAIPPVGAGPAPAASPLTKLITRPERKVQATEMAMVWRNRIAYLPDPSRNGAMGAGLAGQMFLFGGLPKMEFVQADGTLTVDLIDESPRPPGQPSAKPERWQFDKNTLRNLKTVDETFGKSYVLFLPWSAYRPDITRVRVSARYDPENGHTLFSPPSVITLDMSTPLGAPVWDKVAPGSEGAGSNPYRPQPSALPMPGGMPSINSAPIPLGGAPVPSGGAMAPLGGAPIPIGAAAAPAAAPGTGIPMPAGGVMPLMPPPPAIAPGFAPPAGAMPYAPVPPAGGPVIAPPVGAMPYGASNERLDPIMTTIQR